MSTPTSRTLRIAFVTGTSPQKWFRRFAERVPARLITEFSDNPRALLDANKVDMALVRAVDTDSEFPEDLHRIRIYDEAWGVAFEKEHTFSIAEQILVSELEGELVLLESTSPAELREMLSVVATGAGIAIGPRPILRELAKKEVKSADLLDADGTLQSHTSIWLIWPKSEDDETRQEFVGIVQGRRAGSTRSAVGNQAAETPERRLTAREKTLAKQRRREANKSESGQGRGRASGAGKAGGRSAGSRSGGRAQKRHGPKKK